MKNNKKRTKGVGFRSHFGSSHFGLRHGCMRQVRLRSSRQTLRAFIRSPLQKYGPIASQSRPGLPVARVVVIIKSIRSDNDDDDDDHDDYDS